MNFNGYAHGDMTFTAPKGTPIRVILRTLGAQMPHSAVVTDWSHRQEVAAFPPAFAGAATDQPTQGTMKGQQSFSFVADKPGEYAIVCGIPGHALAGMWVALKVVDQGPPRVEAKDQPTFVLPTAEALH
jgi:hypothetical protein